MMITLFADPGTNRKFAKRIQFEEAYSNFLRPEECNTQYLRYNVNIAKIKSRVIMDDPMGELLKYPKSKKWKGLYTYCNYCGYNLSDKCKDTGKSINSCPHKDKHIFRAYYHVPGTKQGKRTRKFFTRDADEAIRLAMEFEKEVKNGKRGAEREQENNLGAVMTVEAAINGYLDRLNNLGVRSSMKRERSEEYKKDVARKLNLLKGALVAKGYDPMSMPVEELDAKAVDAVFDYFNEETDFSNNTFNKHFSHFSSLMQWISLESYPARNWFSSIRKRHTSHIPLAITCEENEALQKIITSENGIAEYHTGVKPERNFYRPYLKYAFRLALETGKRREELINLKYNGITEFPDGSGYIKVEDYKINRIKGWTKEEEKKYHYVPITDSLRSLINEMGYAKYRGTDKYILAPESKDLRNKSMADLLSRAFSHYYKQLNTGRELTFKSFRKAYITSLSAYLRGSELASRIIGHTNLGTTNKHYIDPQVMARELKSFTVFPPEIERNDQLKGIRSIETKNQKPQIEK